MNIDLNPLNFVIFFYKHAMILLHISFLKIFKRFQWTKMRFVCTIFIIFIIEARMSIFEKKNGTVLDFLEIKLFLEFAFNSEQVYLSFYSKIKIKKCRIKLLVWLVEKSCLASFWSRKYYLYFVYIKLV